MTPFILEAALRGAPVVTRDERPVIQLTYFKDCNQESHCLCAVVDNRLEVFTREGRFHLGKADRVYDLFIASIEHTD